MIKVFRSHCSVFVRMMITAAKPSLTPSTSSTFGAVVDQAVASTTGGAVTPTGFCGEVFVVPSEIVAWINLNRGSMPELPFTMEITAYATGVTSAGDRLDTNPIKYFVQFTPDEVVPPTEGSDSSSSSATGLSDSTASTQSTGDSGLFPSDTGTGDTSTDSTDSTGTTGDVGSTGETGSTTGVGSDGAI